MTSISASTKTCVHCGHDNPSWRHGCEQCREVVDGSPGTHSAAQYSGGTDRPGCITTYAILMGSAFLFLVVIGGLALINDEPGIGLALLAFATLQGFVIVGLWRMKNWARYYIIVLQSLGILGGIFVLYSSGGSSEIDAFAGLVQIVIGVIIAGWFLGNGYLFE